MNLYKWSIHCSVEGKYFEVISDTEPTQCPNAHALTAGRTSIVSDANAGTGHGIAGSSLIFMDGKANPSLPINSTSWAVVGAMLFTGTDLWIPTSMKVMLSCATVPAAGEQHDVRIYDVSNANAICQLGWTTLTTVPLMYTTTVFSNLSAIESSWEIQVRLVNQQTPDGKIWFMNLEG